MNTDNFIQQLFQHRQQLFTVFPDKEHAERFIDTLYKFLFVPKKSVLLDATVTEQQYTALKSDLHALLLHVLHDEVASQSATDLFFRELPVIYEALLSDANAILQFDPAARSIEEVLLTYPGFYATAIHRLSHQLWQQEIKVLPRLFSEHAHSKTGIDIHPAARIGHSFFIDHGTGIVIGETTIIGDHVKLYQGVTLGALNVSKDQASQKRHPTIEDHVTIYSGATILGGNTVIGHDSIIGGNVWLTNSVPSFSVVYHKSEIKVRDNNPFPEVVDFVI